MLTRSKLLFAALAAAAMMLTLVANASARNLTLSEKEFEILFNRPGLTFNAAGNVITCPITLLGQFIERTLPKRPNSKVGVIRHVERRETPRPPCTGGTATVNTGTLPWTVNYVSFRGTLPTITSIRLALIGVSFRVSTGSTGCEAGTTERNPAFGEVQVGTGGRVEGLRADETATIPLGGSFICSFAGNSTFSGNGSVLNLPGTAAITVTLI
jgi:hypothetical protein